MASLFYGTPISTSLTFSTYQSDEDDSEPMEEEVIQLKGKCESRGFEWRKIGSQSTV